MKKIILIFATLLLFSQVSNAYLNVVDHRKINEEIISKFLSKYNSFDRFTNYSILFKSVTFNGPAVIDRGNFSVTTANKDFTIKDWIIEGGFSADEPEALAALRHFYDPLAINEGKYYLTDLNIGVVNPAIDAIYWHFDGDDPLSGSNEWSWEKGKEYMANALQATVESQRYTWIAKAFRALGEVLHNTADMGCPPHVRNDAHGGYPGVGGSDPYESGFNPKWASDFSNNNPDPTLSLYFTSSNKAIEIHKKLAEFTNKYFFTNETIYGKGIASYKSRNKMPDYPEPLLEKLEYDEDSYNYYYTFPSGRKVEMCNDRSLFLGYIAQNYRSYPRVTQANVESQATELIPNIISAGVNVIRNFIPQIEFTLNGDLKDKKITGTIMTTKNDEYPTQIKYSGPVKLTVNGTAISTEAIATNGNFEVVVNNLVAGDKIKAQIIFADMVIKSDEKIVSPEPEYKSFRIIGKFYANRVKYNANGEGQHAYDVVDISIATPWIYDITFTKNSNVITSKWTGGNINGEITAVLNSDNTVKVKYSYITSEYTHIEKTEFETVSMPFSKFNVLGAKEFSTNQTLFKSFSKTRGNSTNGTLYEEILTIVNDEDHPFSLTVTLYP